MLNGLFLDAVDSVSHRASGNPPKKDKVFCGELTASRTAVVQNTGTHSHLIVGLVDTVHLILVPAEKVFSKIHDHKALVSGRLLWMALRWKSFGFHWNFGFLLVPIPVVDLENRLNLGRKNLCVLVHYSRELLMLCTPSAIMSAILS